MSQNKSGFTLVELLIVIVVLAVLATISVVAYNGVQDRARSAATSSELSANLKQVAIYAAATGTMPSLADIANSPDASLQFNESNYEFVIYCYTDSDAGFGAQLTNGATFFDTTQSDVTRDDNADVDSACAQAGITQPNGDPANSEAVIGTIDWTHCANENQSCTFSGIKDVRYGADTRWVEQQNVNGSISCRNGVFGDPAPGTVKTCQYR